MPTHPIYRSIDDRGRLTVASRISAAIFVHVLPTAASVVAVVFVCQGLVSKADLWIFASMYIANAAGVTVGYHRLFTHRSFETPAPVRWLLALLGSLTAQGGPILWAAMHRRHHAFPDEPGDPHSPHVGRAPGLLGTIAALWHSHYGHVFEQIEAVHPDKYAPDLTKDPFLRAVEKAAGLLALVGLAIPFGLGYWATGTVRGAWTGLLWGGLVRLFVITHASGAVNSLCHCFGTRRFHAAGHSRNVWWLVPLTLGESWHNGHHAFPSSARHGLRRFEIDPTWILIWLMEKVGLARNVVRIGESDLQSKALVSR